MAESSDPTQARPQFGSRLLTDPDKVFEHNAWDRVEWDAEQERQAEEAVKHNSSILLPDNKIVEYERKADHFWDSFYMQHQNRFFKDRHWLFTEFPELLGPQGSHDAPPTSCDAVVGECGGHVNKHAQCASFRILEVGCGAGNCVFPILQTSSCKELFIYCCDFAPSAVTIVKESHLYDTSKCHAFLCDITAMPMPLPPPGSMDVVILIFVLSAIAPQKMPAAINNMVNTLKPGGLLLFRDYGCYDMAQLRFKPGKCLEKNFYVRGDGTRVYFFTKGEISELFQGAGLNEEQLLVDRRLQVNRGKQLKMYRIWIQAKYRKPK